MPYFVYGKRTMPWYNEDTKKMNEPDSNFRALSGRGIRVNKLTETCVFAEKADAQEFIDKHKWREGTQLEIRKKN